MYRRFPAYARTPSLLDSVGPEALPAELRAPRAASPTGGTTPYTGTAELERGVVVVRSGRATVCFPRDSLPPAHMQGIADTLGRDEDAVRREWLASLGVR